MRLLDDDTLMAQSAASPEYEVTARFETRGRGPFDRPVGNFSLVATNLPGAQWRGCGGGAARRRGVAALLHRHRRRA